MFRDQLFSEGPLSAQIPRVEDVVPGHTVHSAMGYLYIRLLIRREGLQ
jgi:hypothetical protein